MPDAKISLVDIVDKTILLTSARTSTCSSFATDTVVKMTHGSFSSKRKIGSVDDQPANENSTCTAALKGGRPSNKVARSCLLKKSPSRRHLVNLGEDAISSTQDRIFYRANPSSLLSLSSLSAAISSEGKELQTKMV